MKKIGILALALIIAVGTLGVGFAHWGGYLYVNGTAETGTFGAEMSLDLVEDSETRDADPQDIGKCSAQLIDLDQDGVMDKVEITVTDAYPCYSCYVEVDIHNTGSIPITHGQWSLIGGNIGTQFEWVITPLTSLPKLHTGESNWWEFEIHCIQTADPPLVPVMETFDFQLEYQQAQ